MYVAFFALRQDWLKLAAGLGSEGIRALREVYRIQAGEVWPTIDNVRDAKYVEAGLCVLPVVGGATGQEVKAEARSVENAAPGTVMLQSDLGAAFRPITDSAERCWIDGFKAGIAKTVKSLPPGRTSAFDRGSKIVLAKQVGPVTSGDIHLLARDLGVEVAYVEEGGKRFLYIGESPTRVAIGSHPEATRIMHAQPTNPMPSPKDLAAFKEVKNKNAVFEIVTETSESHRKFTVSFAPDDVKALTRLEVEELGNEIMKRTLQKMLDQGINFAK